MKVLGTLHLWANVLPHRAAIIQPRSITTYRELVLLTQSIVDYFARMGLPQDKPVAVAVSDPTLMVAIIFALLGKGHNVAPANAALIPHLAPNGIEILIYDGEIKPPGALRSIKFDPSSLERPIEKMTLCFREPGGEASLIFFTSGTTGLPKKVVQPASALEAILKNPVTRLAAPHQKVLIMGGLTSGFGLNRVFEVLHLARTVCFANEGISALSLINLFAIEVAMVSVTQALGLADTRALKPGLCIDSLRTLFVSGAKLQPEGLERIRSALCRNVIDYYSSLETGVVAFANTDAVGGVSGTQLVPWVDVEIMDDQGQPQPQGGEGVLRIRSQQLRENIAAAGPASLSGVRDGWFYSTDIGRIEADGRLHLAGRSIDVINRGGVKVSGNRIEQLLLGVPGVKEAAACAVPGAGGVDEFWVAIVPDGPLNIENIKAYLREHHEIQLAPDQVVLLEKLPRGDLGKIQKAKLKDMLLQRTIS
jgi:acyl-coenzyme A synthetase/AMP-(fatty) acid ligase